MKENVETFKIITLGDSGVGRTAIVKRYVQGTFEEEYISTVGTDFFYKEVKLKDGTKIKLKLIDTAGQEKYRAISKSYYKNAQGILFIFAYDNKDSFEHMQMWLNSCKDNISIIENIPIFLIGNKYDVENKQIKDNLIENLEKRNGIEEYIKTSAKKNIGIEELFNKLAEKVYEQNKKDIKPKQKNAMLFKDKGQKRKKKCCADM